MNTRPAGKRFATIEPVPDTSVYARPATGAHHAGSAGRVARTVGFAVLGIVLAVIIVLAILAALVVPSALRVKDAAQGLEPAARQVMATVTSDDTSALPAEVQTLRQGVAQIQGELAGVGWNVLAALPVIGQDVTNARTLVDTALDLVDDAATPVAQVVAEHPLKTIVSSEGADGVALDALCGTLSDVTPAVQKACATVQGMSAFSIPQLDAAFGQVKGLASTINAFLGNNADVFRQLPALLGCQGERTYLLVAQNNAEIRASGGLPGAMILVTMDNGSMSFGDVHSLDDIMAVAESPLPLTDEEVSLFGESMGTTPANMTFTPEFPRAAQLLADSWAQVQGVNVDGVIALDPAMFQRILALAGEFTLSDGTVVNGDNAAYVLLNQTYWLYGEDGDLMDARFAEVASMGLDLVKERLDSIDKTALLQIVSDCIDERRFLVWMANADEEAIADRLGCSGELNDDASQPELGVFVNDSTWSKIDWYLQMQNTVGTAVRNADGTLSYPVTTTLTNTISEEDAATSPGYITGFNSEKYSDSDALTTLYLYAPAGGSISDVQVTSGAVDLAPATHNGLQVLFGLTHLQSGETLTVTYTVTTAAGSDPLVVRSTPMANGD